MRARFTAKALARKAGWEQEDRNMKLIKVLSVVLMVAVFGGMLGCGGGAEVRQTTNATTLGKELQDLDDAYKKGLLSEKEYKEARKNLMKKYDD
jgi:hypothetical protein